MSNANGAGKVVPLRAPHRNRGVNLWQREVVLEELDYLDTPPSPIRMWLILIICGTLLLCRGSIDCHPIVHYAIAQARRATTGHRSQCSLCGRQSHCDPCLRRRSREQGHSLAELDALDGTEEINTRAIDAARTKGDEAPQGPTTVIGKSDQTRLVEPSMAPYKPAAGP